MWIVLPVVLAVVGMIVAFLPQPDERDLVRPAPAPRAPVIQPAPARRAPQPVIISEWQQSGSRSSTRRVA
jgi:hypothetical protein